MKMTVYQIEPVKDRQRLTFRPLDSLKALRGGRGPDPSDYEKVFEGEVRQESAEELASVLPSLRFPDFSGRQICVSDVVELKTEDGPSAFYYRDPEGLVPVPFDPERAAPGKDRMINVVLCEPGRLSRTIRIGTELADFQRIVGGLIEACYPFREEVCIVCNEEGKLNGMQPCRAVLDEDGRVTDIVFGPFFICGCAGESFESLSGEQLERYAHDFLCPERYYRENGELKAVPFFPERKRETAREERG